MSHHLPMYEFSIYVNLIGFFKKKKKNKTVECCFASHSLMGFTQDY